MAEMAQDMTTPEAREAYYKAAWERAAAAGNEARAALASALERAEKAETEREFLATLVGSAIVLTSIDTLAGEAPAEEPTHALTSAVMGLVRARDEARAQADSYGAMCAEQEARAAAAVAGRARAEARVAKLEDDLTAARANIEGTLEALTEARAAAGLKEGESLADWIDLTLHAERQAESREAVLLVALGIVVQEIERRDLGGRRDGNAPGHGHQVPGVWDEDNGAKAGTKCAWCEAWPRIRALASPTTRREPDGAVTPEGDTRSLQDMLDLMAEQGAREQDPRTGVLLRGWAATLRRFELTSSATSPTPGATVRVTYPPPTTIADTATGQAIRVERPPVIVPGAPRATPPEATLPPAACGGGCPCSGNVDRVSTEATARLACGLTLAEHIQLAPGFEWVSHGPDGCGCQHPSGEGALRHPHPPEGR